MLNENPSLNQNEHTDFESFYDHAPIAYLALDREKNIHEINAAAAEILGINKNVAIGKNIISFLDGNDKKYFSELFIKSFEKKEKIAAEFNLEISGRKIFTNMIFIPSDESTEDKNLKIFFSDVTSKKIAEHIKDESEKRFRLMADNSPVMIWMIDAANDIVYMNQTKLDFLGIKAEELTFENWLETRHPEDRQKFLNVLSDAVKKQEKFSIEIRVKDAEGNYRWLLDTAAPKFTDDGSFAGFIGSGIDITERRAAEKVIKDSEERFRRMADSSQVMIWMTDANNNLEYMNKTKLGFLGKDQDEINYKTWIESRHPDDRETFLQTLKKAAKNKRGFSIEVRVKNAEGNYRWLLDSAAPRYSDDGSFAGFIGSGIDITEEKAFRAYLQKSLKEKEVLLMEIHHRVKNNLQIITSLLSLQSSRVKDEETLEIFRTSQDRVRSMALLHEKLYKSKDIHRINIREYFEDLINYLMTSYNQVNKVNLKLQILDVQVDINLSITLGLIINELISNSIKHAFKGKNSGEIYVELSRTGRRDELQLIVADNGIGFPKDFNIEKSDSLGLELVRTLVVQHDGKFKMLRDHLTKFIITLQYSHDSVSNHQY